MQDRVLGDAGLDKDCVLGGIDPSRQPINQQLADEFADLACIGVVSRQRVPVGHEKITVELVLESFPIFQRAYIVAEMEQPARLHATKDPPLVHGVNPAPSPIVADKMLPDTACVKV